MSSPQTPQMGMQQPIFIPMMMQPPPPPMPHMVPSKPHHNPIVLMLIILVLILILSFVLLEYFPEKVPEKVAANKHIIEIQKQFDKLLDALPADYVPQRAVRDIPDEVADDGSE